MDAEVGNGKQNAIAKKAGRCCPAATYSRPMSATRRTAKNYNPREHVAGGGADASVNLTNGFEIGPQTLRPNGTVWVAGASGLYGDLQRRRPALGRRVPTFPKSGASSSTWPTDRPRC